MPPSGPDNDAKSGLPPVPEGPIVSLVYRTLPEERNRLIEFLSNARTLYEKPGGIKVALYESISEPGLFFELVAYKSEADFEADQLRIENDAELKQTLDTWHQFIDGPLEVKLMRPVDLNH